ncbi:hypothetical protein [Rufibacter aurantiacus]|uniref:hypothetical protein n=1 Tax=Rufibacter aurantiacus TaxID=2817374 RepID=UPI001B30C552|nr:hypothetical protein [Rufibacter aurantiacus]
MATYKTSNSVAKHKTSLITFLILMTLGTLIFRACRYYWSPHYIGNRAVEIDGKLYSPDSTAAVVFYTLDVGARGTRSYKSLLKEKDYDDELTAYNLPPEIVVEKWVDNKTLNVKYDPNEIYRLGGTHTDLDLTKDTVVVNDVFLVIKQRVKVNRDSVLHQNFGRYQ